MKYITDTLKGENPILTEIYSFVPLIFKDDRGQVIVTVEPESAWTHERLLALNTDVLTGHHKNAAIDAFIGDCWVGSTEV